MGIKITGSKKSSEAKAIMKVISALSTFSFENDTFLKTSEKEVIKNCQIILHKAYERTT